MKTKYEIVERSSGFWVVNGSDAFGPFDSIVKANGWIKRQTKRKKSPKVATVNVVETLDGKIASIRSFTESPEGNKAAEDLFRHLHKEHNDPDGTTDVARPTREDFRAMLDDGIYDDDCGYNLIVTHSS